MSDIETRIVHPLGAVDVTVEFNWQRLGMHFMRVGSDEQAAFLRGWDYEASALGFVKESFQYGHVADAIQDETTRRSLAEWLRLLARALDPEVTR